MPREQLVFPVSSFLGAGPKKSLAVGLEASSAGVDSVTKEYRNHERRDSDQRLDTNGQSRCGGSKTPRRIGERILPSTRLGRDMSFPLWA